MRKFKCANGKTYGVLDNCCLTCAHAPDIWYDSEGPYMVECDVLNTLMSATHVCDKWEDDGNGEEGIL